MREIKPYLLGSFFLLVALSGVVLAIILAGQHNTVASVAATSYQPPAQLTVVPTTAHTSEDAPTPVVSPQLPSGGPAIKPSISNPKPGEAAFTSADVERYITDSGMELYLGRRIHFESPPEISKIEFLTERELKSRPGALSTGLPDDSVLYYVELKGAFELNSPPNQTPPQTFHIGVLVFNAQTGNIMIAGAKP